MATQKARINRKQMLSSSVRVAVRFETEEDYCLVHHAADHARLSMNAWMAKVLLAAAEKEVPNFVPKKPWARREDRNGRQA